MTARTWRGENTDNEHAPLAHDAHDAIVGAGASGGGVDEDANILIDIRIRSPELVDHALDVGVAEALLERVEGEAAELGGDEIRAVLQN